MAANLGPKITRAGLVLKLDAGDKNSYSGSGNNWKDLTGRVGDRTLTNGPTFNSTNGGHIVLDGTNDYIVDSNLTSFNVGCIDMWIKPAILVNASSTIQVILQLKYGAALNSSWYICLGSSTSLLTNEYITIVNSSNDTRTAVADGGSLLANTWYNLVFNWESTIYKIYVNNILKTTINAVAGNVAQLTNPNAFYIGAIDGDTLAPRSFFNGSVAITRLYNRTLTAAELLQNFNSNKARLGI